MKSWTLAEAYKHSELINNLARKHFFLNVFFVHDPTFDLMLCATPMGSATKVMDNCAMLTDELDRVLRICSFVMTPEHRKRQAQDLNEPLAPVSLLYGKRPMTQLEYTELKKIESSEYGMADVSYVLEPQTRWLRETIFDGLVDLGYVYQMGDAYCISADGSCAMNALD